MRFSIKLFKMNCETLLILDFGVPTTQLIARRVRQSHVYCRILPGSTPIEKIRAIHPKGLILADAREDFLSENLSTWEKELLDLNIPILAVGMSQKFFTVPTDSLVFCEVPATSAALKTEIGKFVGKCGCLCDWTMKSFAENTISRLQEQIGQERVICGLSGGVDSAVVAALLSRAVGTQLTCIFVDTGLMRKSERKSVQKEFTGHFQTDLRIVDAESVYLEKLAGIVEPQLKRKTIGHLFIDIFSEEAAKIQGAKFLAQGTVYPDILESGGTSETPASTIKLHHNVGGLPDDLEFDLVEPLRELFKDEVRELGMQLGLPEEMVWRHPFPGPGLAVRCLGEVTKERLNILREADAIVVEEIKNAGLYRDVSQAFAVLLPVQSVGVSNNERTYENAVVVRCVVTEDFVHADWARLPYHVLESISNRVIREVAGVNRVAYDISSKPPATIEWE